LSDFAAMTTLAPSRAARSAMARPIPREPPVMKSVRFFSGTFSVCIRSHDVSESITYYSDIIQLQAK